MPVFNDQGIHLAGKIHTISNIDLFAAHDFICKVFADALRIAGMPEIPQTVEANALEIDENTIKYSYDAANISLLLVCFKKERSAFVDIFCRTKVEPYKLKKSFAFIQENLSAAKSNYTTFFRT